jgi:hypothetical protein
MTSASDEDVNMGGECVNTTSMKFSAAVTYIAAKEKYSGMPPAISTKAAD